MSDRRDAERTDPGPAVAPQAIPVPPPAAEPFGAAPPDDELLAPSFWPDVGSRRSGRVRALALFLAALLGAAAGTGATLFLADRLDEEPAPAGPGVVRVAPPIEEGGDLPASAAAEVAARILPSIVRIDVALDAREGTGSGVLYRPDGYIVTNDHVVSGADDIRVRLSTGEELDASFVGTAAPGADIAVIKVAKAGLPAATLGSTENLRPGDLAVAVGSPFGLEGTVTAGVVSALHRNINLGRGARFTDAIQTDAPINPGNSGGALVDARGTVIGINTAIVGGPANVGVGFAIPIGIVRKVADQIIQTGRARLPFLGVLGGNLPEGRGALIVEVREGTPAAQAGLRADDVIVALDGEPIGSMDELIEVLIEKDVGQRVSIEFERDGQRRAATAVLAALLEG